LLCSWPNNQARPKNLGGNLQDHLQLFTAFQSLAEIGSRIQHVYELWNEIDLVRHGTDYETINGLISSLQTSVFDIVDSMDLNLLLLHTHISTRFGNVKSLQAKKSQKRYYQQQASQLYADLTRLSKVADNVERESSARSMEELSRFLRRNILSRISEWQHGLSEIQTKIRRDIFRTREVEENLRLLARMDLLLRQQPGWRGVDVALDGDIPDFLLAARLPALVPNVDALDSDFSIQREMVAIAITLPPKPTTDTDNEPLKRFTRVVSPPKEPEVTPGTLALERLVAHVEGSEAEVSLAAWRSHDADAQTMQPHVWLVFAVMGLRGRRIAVSLIRANPNAGERFRHQIQDATANGKNNVGSANERR
jgi:ElaB/YqjD/DUF883 family membrane-anchored ribosome-binding protein